jgi:serine/threonine-protein kinase
MVGMVLGSYRITGELARGGMGTVYRAQHELLGRPAAVKLLLPQLTSDQVLVERFFNEARAATAIRHPGIIEVYDFGYTDDGQAYLVMEFLEGVTLARAIADRGRLSEAAAAAITRGIANALKAAHGKGIVHRDLKPDNVFLVPDPDGPTGERVKVLDFGIAKLADAAASDVRHTRTGALIGTPLYMAPEQARAAGMIDHRADLYSLGCILYELLVGEPPFVAEGAGEIIALQMFGEPTPPSARLEAITPGLEQLVLRLLAKEPEDRFGSAGDVVAALDAVTATLFARPATTLAATSENRPQLRLPPGAQRTPLPAFDLASEAPAPAPKRTAMPIIAGAITVVLAAAVTLIVVIRGHGDPVSVAPSPAAAPTTAPTTAPAPAPTPAPVATPQPPRQPTDPAPRPPKRDPVPAKHPAPRPRIQRGPTAPAIAGPVTHPGTTQGPVTSTTGPATANGSPIFNNLDDDKPKQKQEP